MKQAYLITKTDGSPALLFDRVRAHGIAGHHGWTVRPISPSEARTHIKATLKKAAAKGVQS